MPFAQIDQTTHARLLRRGRHVVGQQGAARPRSTRVREDVRAREAQLLAERQRPLEIRLALPGETGDHVRRDSAAGHRRPDPLDRPHEPRHVVAAPHPPQHRVAPALQRQVEMPAHAAVLPLRQQLRRHVLRLNRRIADPRDRRLRQQRLDQPRRVAPVRAVAPVRPRLRPRQHHLQRPRLLARPAPPRPPRRSVPPARARAPAARCRTRRRRRNPLGSSRTRVFSQLAVRAHRRCPPRPPHAARPPLKTSRTPAGVVPHPRQCRPRQPPNRPPQSHQPPPALEDAKLRAPSPRSPSPHPRPSRARSPPPPVRA